MALKVISKARAHSKGSVQDMVDEKKVATAMTDMDHPFIVKFFGSFQVPHTTNISCSQSREWQCVRWR